MSPLYCTLTKLLEVDAVQPHDHLRNFDNWDSLTVLSLCAVLDASYGVRLSAQDLQAITTVEDLERLVASRKAA